MVAMNTSQIGRISEAHVLAKLASGGWNILIPFGDGHIYDFVIEKQGNFSSVQIKTARFHAAANTISFSLRASDSRAGESRFYSDIDFFGVYCRETDGVYLVPKDGLAKYDCTLRLSDPKNNQSKGIRLAKRFLI